jgi:hypothetical protein
MNRDQENPVRLSRSLEASRLRSQAGRGFLSALFKLIFWFAGDVFLRSFAR